MMKTIYPLLLFGLLLPTLAAQETPKKPARDSYRTYTEAWGRDSDTVIIPKDVRGQYLQLTVSPAKLPDPLLKYRLRVFSTEKESGNAAYLYSAALGEFNSVLNRTQDDMLRSEEFRNINPAQGSVEYRQMQFKAFPLYPQWPSEGYVEITAEEEANLYKSLDRVWFLMERASRKTYYDWSDSFEFAGIETLLSNIQEMRVLARYLSGKADWEIRNGKYDDAIKTIRVGLVLGEHTRDSKPFNCLMTGLVGLAIQGIMQSKLHELACQPDAPNLYAAMTQLEFSPRAVLNPMEGERLWMFPRQVSPEIYETIDQASAEECHTILRGLSETFFAAGTDSSGPNGTLFQTERGKRFFESLICVFSYPFAKERLLAQGKTEEQIDALSTYQIVTPHLLEEIQREYDKLQVISALPHGESHTEIVFDDSNFRFRPEPVSIYLALFLPATQAAKYAYFRTEQNLDRLKIVEAIRLYAALHDGQLPQSLEDIKEVPVPKIDPMNGKPYQYRVEGNVAMFEYEQTGGLSRMEIRLK